MTAQLIDFGGDPAMGVACKFVYPNEDYTICATCGEEWLTGGCNCLMDFMSAKVEIINACSKEINQGA